MGGPIALLAWHRHPGRVQGLVLCATAGDFRGSSTERLLHLALEEVDRVARLVPRPLRVRAARSLVHGLATDATFKADLLDALHHHDEAAVREASRAVRRFSASWLDEVSVPAAIVVTERDHLVLPSRQRDLARRIPGAQVVPVEANHMAFCDRPNVLAPALVEACRIVAGQLDPDRAPERSRLLRRWSRWRRRRRSRSRARTHQVPRAVGHAWRGHSPAEAEVRAG
jgi:pimeloyl-ACP methyl ester carboxylesterase